MESGYRVVEVVDGRVRSLYHGTNGSREIRLGVWNRCRGGAVHDGSEGRDYEAGWHYFSSEDRAMEFFSSLRIKAGRYIVRCYIRGNIRMKWSGKCMLADEIMIRKEDVPISG
jgi:hypothetical protein